MSKKLSLIERWEIDAQAGMVIWRCNSCHNYLGNNKCSVYGASPKEIAEMKKTCDEFERKPLDTE